MPHKEKLKVQKKINLIRWCQAGKNRSQPDSGAGGPAGPAEERPDAAYRTGGGTDRD